MFFGQTVESIVVFYRGYKKVNNSIVYIIILFTLSRLDGTYRTVLLSIVLLSIVQSILLRECIHYTKTNYLM